MSRPVLDPGDMPWMRCHPCPPELGSQCGETHGQVVLDSEKWWLGDGMEAVRVGGGSSHSLKTQ